MHQTIGIVIPTYQAAKHLPYCLPPLLASPLKPRLLVIDSCSTDGTAAIASKMGAETIVIPKNEFNHGSTRELGRRHLGTPIIVMITQDAYATSPGMLEKLIAPIRARSASLTYGRQIPHVGAGVLASFARRFNYPDKSYIRSIADLPSCGAHTFFCSNSCAAYCNAALDEAGGFPAVAFGEDTIMAAKLVRRGRKIAYVAEAEVRHSHDYSLREEFLRHIMMGTVRRRHKELLSSEGFDSKRGKAYVKALMQELWRSSPHLLPYAVLQTAVKWTGYQYGKHFYTDS